MIAPRSPTSNSSAIPKGDHVEFCQLVGVEVVKSADGSQVLVKANDLGCRWNASAASTHSITGAFFGSPGPRGIAFVPTRLPSSGGYVIGLASAAGERNRDLMEDQGLASLDFAIHVVSRGDFLSSSSNLDVRELGSHQGTFGTFTNGDKVEVVLNEHGKVEYRVNSQVRHVSERAPEYPLYVKLCACATGNIVRDVRWVGPGLLEHAHQHVAREERHQRQVDHLEERLQEMACHCQEMDEYHQEMFRERDALQRSQEQQLATLEARFTEMAQQFHQREEHYQQLFKSMEGRLEGTSEERDASRRHGRALEEQLELIERQRAASEDFHSEHLTSTQTRLTEHSEQLHTQLSMAEERLAEHARQHASEAVEHYHREHLDTAQRHLARNLEAHQAQVSTAEEQALERLRARAAEVSHDVHQQRLRTAEGEMAQLHRSLANEHLGASEKRLIELQRTLATDLEQGIHRQLTEATRQVQELTAAAQPYPPSPGSHHEAAQEPSPEAEMKPEAVPPQPPSQTVVKPPHSGVEEARPSRPHHEAVQEPLLEARPQTGALAPQPGSRNVGNVPQARGTEVSEQRSGAEEALRERLRQLAAIEEKMRLTTIRYSPAVSPSNDIEKPEQVNGRGQ